MMASSQAVAPTVRRLLLLALGVFLVTVAIGMINGLDLYTFSRDQLLTHATRGPSAGSRSPSSRPRCG